MSGVTLEHVTKAFGKAKGVENVHIEIKQGEFFTFLGPSGCGKTTTLRMIAGFYYPTSGRILFANADMTYVSPHKRNTGMVFQNYALFPHMTVFENIAFGLQVRKRNKTEIKEKVERAQRLVHLDGYGNRRIDQLSGGQQQRVALARALVIEPSILLLDEPLSNLDAKLREETRLEIKRLQVELGITTIYVTHDQAEAMAMSDRIMVMQSGEVQQIGTPDDIYNRPSNRFVASFIGETNLWEGEVVQIDGEEVSVQIEPDLLVIGYRHHVSTSESMKKGAKVSISVRPEAIQIKNEKVNTQADVIDQLLVRETNQMKGQIIISEFTGASITYVCKVGDKQHLRAMFIHAGSQVKQRGETITLHIPKASVYFILTENPMCK
ncbi:ABC transporter ATP-binding protein [Brevibacillus laterosporus]|nr:ABC transporter ATP-binding protein [Brevibacillus laterosporus]RAP28660.1 hypothetical protein C2W64_04716 [Brevibacillus laterosporus]TPG69199.1 ABC transporter ATP-binding protein [Brevibacillus laterosporus]TPG84264.1 ABC transporter ATP-binding protein [Brevibacillus laterosporus]